MKSIREFVGHELEWVQPSAMRREFELRSGTELLGTLRFRSAFGSLATAEAAEGRWTFKRVGFWQARVTVRVAETEGEIASFHNSTWGSGGTLTLASGRAWRASTNFWMSKYEFKNEAEEPLVKYRRVGGLLHLSSIVEVTPQGAQLAELPWLASFGWYLAIKLHDDASGAAAGAAAAAG